jgi:hypothetical protein
MSEITRIRPAKAGQRASVKAKLLEVHNRNHPASELKPEVDLNELPINVINDRLDQAHATLDLIYTMTINHDCSEEHIEALCKNTPSTARCCALRKPWKALRGCTHERRDCPESAAFRGAGIATSGSCGAAWFRACAAQHCGTYGRLRSHE